MASAPDDREAKVPESILDATQACFRSFKECLIVPALKHREWVENRLADFNLWAAGVGASAKEGLSLDSRLVCEPGMRTVVIDLLRTLIVYVHQCKTIGLEVESQGEESAATSSKPLLKEAMDGTEALLDQLANLAVVICQAGTSSRLQKADRSFNRARHLNLDNHLKVLLQARPEGHASIKEGGPEDENFAEDRKVNIGADHFGVVPMPLDPVKDHFVSANLRRRNRFMYAQRHARSLATFTPEPIKPKGQSQKLVAESSSPVKTQQVHQRVERDELAAPVKGQDKADTETTNSMQSRGLISKASTFVHTDETKDSTISTPSQQAMTQASHTALKVTIPRPRNPGRGLKTFKCPCCCQVLPPSSFTERNQWIKHLAQDLCPYTCPIPLDGCPNPLNLYRNKKSWLKHINTEHRALQRWQCIVCDDGQTFLTLQTFSTHLSTHPNISESTFSTLIEACSQEKPPDISSCPLCTWANDQADDVDRDSLLDHIAEHTYSFSMLSLPWADDETAKEVPEELISRVQVWLKFVPWEMDGDGDEISEDILDRAEARLESVLSEHIHNPERSNSAFDYEWLSWLWPSRQRDGLIKENPIEEDMKWLSWLDLPSTERQEIARPAIQTVSRRQDRSRYFNDNDYFSDGSGKSGLLSDRAHTETSIPDSQDSLAGRSAGLPSLDFSESGSFGLATLHLPTQEHVSSGQAIDIIAVHGLGEDSFSAWTDQSSGKLWLEDFLPLSEFGKRTRIMTFGYDANVFAMPLSLSQSNNNTIGMLVFAERLLDNIQESRRSNEERARPIIFIAHSLGGIVVKNALSLITDPSIYEDVFRCTQGILFFGTPHQGSDTTVLLHYLTALQRQKMMSAGSGNLKQRQDWSHALSEICISFSNVSEHFPIAMFYEMRKTKGAMPTYKDPRTTCCIHTTEGKSVGLDADHFDMCKFSSMMDEDYLRVLRIIEAMIRGIDAESQLTMNTHEPDSMLGPLEGSSDTIEDTTMVGYFDGDGDSYDGLKPVVEYGDYSSTEAKSADEWVSKMKKIHDRTGRASSHVRDVDRRIEIEVRDSWEGFVATIDTGTEENWISRDVVSRLKLAVKTTLPTQHITLDGQVVSSEKTLELTWRLARQSKSEIHIFRVSPPGASFEVLFGRNLLASGEVDFESVNPTPIKIAVLDTGVNVSHPFITEKQRHITQGMSFVEGREGTEDVWWADSNGHGTHTAALLLEAAPDAQLYIAKVAKGSQIPENHKIADAIRWAIDCQVDLITITFGLKNNDRSVHKAIVHAYSNRVIIFAAASSGRGDKVTFPATSREVIPIYATNGVGNPWAGNPTTLNASAYHFATLGVAVRPSRPAGEAQRSPLLESYRGTYQFISPMPSPTLLGLASTSGNDRAVVGSIRPLSSDDEGKGDEQTEPLEVRRSGTSFATTIAAGIAAYILDFARVHEMRPQLYQQLHSLDGMQKVLAAYFVAKSNGLDYICPWRLFTEHRTSKEIVSLMEDTLGPREYKVDQPVYYSANKSPVKHEIQTSTSTASKGTNVDKAIYEAARHPTIKRAAHWSMLKSYLEVRGVTRDVLQKKEPKEWMDQLSEAIAMLNTIAPGWFYSMEIFEKSKETWNSSHSRVKIAILDTGIDILHLDIERAYRHGRITYQDFMNDQSASPGDLNRHGTYCTSLIAKFAPNSDIYVCRVFRESTVEEGSAEAVAKAIQHARTQWQVDIISLSFGFREDDDDVQDEIRKTSASNTLIVAAAGTNTYESTTICFPARMKEVISVFSADAYGRPSSFNPPPSSDRMNFTFPGEMIEGAWPSRIPGEGTFEREGATYKFRNGCSGASAIAAAVAAGVLEFAWKGREPNIRRAKLLKHDSGMSEVFSKLMVDGPESGYPESLYQYVKPWKLITTTQRKEEIPDLISNTLDQAFLIR